MVSFSAKQTVIGLAIGGLVAPLLLGCSPKNEYVPPPPPKVTVARPIQMDVTTFIEETGVTEAYEHVEIRTRVEGYLDSIPVEDGAEVAAGDTLFVIDKRPFEAEVAKAEAARVVAIAEAENAKAQLLRAKPLFEKQAISKEELDEKSAAYLVTQASIKYAEAELEQAKLELSYCDIVSPINGRTGGRLIDVGSFVGRSMNTHLATVVRYDPIYASFNISERVFLQLLKDGPRRSESGKLDAERIPFYLALPGEDFTHEGHFDYADLGVESGTGTFRVRGIFANPEPRMMTPGMTVQIRMPLGQIKGAILIPERAVAADQAGRYVLIVNAEGVVERRDVQLGLKQKNMIVVSLGLKGDEQVIIEGLQRARPNVKVEAETAELTAPEIPQMKLPGDVVESPRPPALTDEPSAAENTELESAGSEQVETQSQPAPNTTDSSESVTTPDSETSSGASAVPPIDNAPAAAPEATVEPAPATGAVTPPPTATDGAGSSDAS